MALKLFAPLISVIVPVYNVEPYLDRCVQSILAQTFSDFELILVDDGSPDNCPTMCDEWAKRDFRITVIHQRNGGLSAARNAGIDWSFENSNSKWLMFVDSDDWIHPEMLELLLRAVYTYDVDVSACCHEEVTGIKPVADCSNVSAKLWESEKFFRINPVYATMASAKLYRKTLFSELRYPVGKIHEDEFVTYKTIFANKYIAFLDRPLYSYFRNPLSITRSAWSFRRLDAIAALEERIVYFESVANETMAQYAQLQLSSRIAWLNLQAYKAHMHRNFPQKYKLSFLNAIYVLEKMNGTDRYESIMSGMFPHFVIWQSRFRKIVSIILGRDIRMDGQL